MENAFEVKGEKNKQIEKRHNNHSLSYVFILTKDIRTCEVHRKKSVLCKLITFLSTLILGATVIKMSGTNSTQAIQSSLISDVLLIWLDPNSDISNEDINNTINEVQHIISSYRIFTNIDECIDFVTDVKNEKIFMILPCSVDHQTISCIEDIVQLHLIYIVYHHQEKHKEWITDHKKIKEILIDIETIYDILQCDIQRLESSLTSISILSTSSSHKLEELEPSFMYSQILKDIIINMEHDKNAIQKFVNLWFQYHSNDINRLNALNFQKNYEPDSPILWYSKEEYLYSTLNKALRTQDTAVIIKIGFFIKDLHQQIKKLHSEAHLTELITVYRGQGLSNIDFEKFKKSKGGLVSFNNFLSTSFNYDVSRMFAESSSYDPHLIGILFRMNIDPSKSSTPFAFIKNISHHPDEEEILFSMHTIFRIGEIEQLQDRLWQIDLILTNDDDQELRNLTEYIKLEIESGTGWQKMGQLLTKMGEFDKAIEIYNTLLETIPDITDEETITSVINNYNNIAAAYEGKGDSSTALSYYEKALQIEEKFYPDKDARLAITYNNMAVAYQSIGNYPEALKYLEKTLEIQQKSLPSNSPQIAITFNNLATIYRRIGNYSSAVSYLEKALDIQKESLPSTHPDLAMTYNNISELRLLLGDHFLAISNYEKAFQIWRKSLPTNHPHLAVSYNTMGELQRMNGYYSKALFSCEKALEIAQISLPSNHSWLATIHNNIALVYQTMKNYSSAILHFEKTLQILKESHTLNVSNSILIYNNIAAIYQSMGQYWTSISYLEKTLAILEKSTSVDYMLLVSTYNNLGEIHRCLINNSIALSYLKKALEIWLKHLPVNHQFLARIYNNLGLVYMSMNDYSTALTHLNKALEIQQRTLPSNHPDLYDIRDNINKVSFLKECITSVSLSSEQELERQLRNLAPDDPSRIPIYYRIAVGHRHRNNTSQALSFIEKILDIQQKTLSSNHPDLAKTYDTMGTLYRSMDDYTTALSYFDIAIEIWQNSLPVNYSNLATTFNTISETYYIMGDYSSALTYLKKVLEINQTSLPSNQVLLTSTYSNMAAILDKLGQNEQAIKYAEQSVNLTCHICGNDHNETKKRQNYLEQLRRKYAENENITLPF
jgi:tetratricopeptide (TPR) repeat protein